jgi:succinate dehydrogenase / fumarate reductase iron-sulfur subunit
MAGQGGPARDYTVEVWRQKNAKDKGGFKTYPVKGISPDASFLEMLDVLNEELIAKGEDPIAFEHDCREGICGSCGFMINGRAHGPDRGVTTCQLHMRRFNTGTHLVLEPWRAKAFPVLKDLVVDRSAFDRVIQAGGYISVDTGSAIEANATPVSKEVADAAMEAAMCIGCGACVASCKNASAMLFTSAKVSHLNMLPQGQPERFKRVAAMVQQMDYEGFGGCTNTGSCEVECPKGISVANIAKMNRDYLQATMVPSMFDK